MDWEDLRYFLALAETGSLSAAARRLGVDHTTVARRVGSLEAALRVRLVDRLPRAVLLTEEGRRVAELGLRMEAEARAVLRAAGGMDEAVRGVVRVSAPPGFARAVLTRPLVALRRRYPSLAVDLIGEQGFADLDRREADLAIRLSPPEGDGLVVRKLGTMPFALYAAPDYVNGRPAEEWEFLAHDGFPVDLPQQDWLDAYAQGRAVAFRSNDHATLAMAAAAGLGAVLLPRYLGDDDPSLREIPCAEPWPCREIWMAVHDDLRRSPRVRAVMDCLAAAVGGSLAA